VVKVVSIGKNQATIVPQSDKPVTTTFLLDVIIPLNAEELAKLAPPPPRRRSTPRPKVNPPLVRPNINSLQSSVIFCFVR
jgi:hypothetical protein